MDPLITATARALAVGDPLGALNRAALQDDAPALPLRASQWPSSAISFERRLSCKVRRALSVRKRRWPRAASAPLRSIVVSSSGRGAPLRPLRKTVAPSRAGKGLRDRALDGALDAVSPTP